jgi:hypothetical protein
MHTINPSVLMADASDLEALLRKDAGIFRGEAKSKREQAARLESQA